MKRNISLIERKFLSLPFNEIVYHSKTTKVHFGEGAAVVFLGERIASLCVALSGDTTRVTSLISPSFADKPTVITANRLQKYHLEIITSHTILLL